jgi:hypothetical protein
LEGHWFLTSLFAEKEKLLDAQIPDTDTDVVLSQRFEHAAKEFTQMAATRGDHCSVKSIYWARRMNVPPPQVLYLIIAEQNTIREDIFHDMISEFTPVSGLRESKLKRDQKNTEEGGETVAG